jgi:hypothetical protein
MRIATALLRQSLLGTAKQKHNSLVIRRIGLKKGPVLDKGLPGGLVGVRRRERLPKLTQKEEKKKSKGICLTVSYASLAYMTRFVLRLSVL